MQDRDDRVFMPLRSAYGDLPKDRATPCPRCGGFRSWEQDPDDIHDAYFATCLPCGRREAATPFTPLEKPRAYHEGKYDK